MNTGDKITITVRLEGKYNYEKVIDWQRQEMTIYKMVDEEENIFVWNTSGILRNPEIEKTGKPISKGDTFQIKATVKGFGEYNGEKQIELQRVKVVEIIDQVETYAERQKRIEKEQMASLNEGDAIWYGMRYKQYKEHYSDCETIYGSFRKNDWGESFVDVILRTDRLKASGVRGEHYSGYEFFVYQNGEKIRTCYRAVNEENALRRCEKEYPEAEKIEAGKIYDYSSRYNLEGYLVMITKEEPKEESKETVDAFSEAYDEFFGAM